MENDVKEKKFDRKPNRPFPRHSIETALVVSKAIQENNAGKPMKRLLVADAIGRKPTSPEFRDLLSSSFKYGLTTGTEKAEYVELTDLGKKMTRPTSPAIEASAKQEIALYPEVFKTIYTHYKDNKFPKGQFFENALEMEFHIPREYVKEVIDVLEQNGKFAEIIRDISGSPHIMLDSEPISHTEKTTDNQTEIKDTVISDEQDLPELSKKSPLEQKDDGNKQNECKPKKIFISHGKNQSVLNQIKTTLEFGGYTPVIATLQETTAIPVPEKIMQAMHECEAGIINISADETFTDGNGKEQFKINENVLIEIGAAFVLYKKKVVLVVDKRVSLPSNLQGLYLCRYEGDSLDWDAGLSLQKALTEFAK